MTEMTYTTVHIGGAIPQNLIGELEELISESFHDLYSDEPNVEAAITAGTSFEVTGNVNYGNPEEVIAFCHEHNLTYWHWCDSGCEWSSHIVIWCPEMKGKTSEVAADSQLYEPLVPLRTLMQFENLQDLRTYLLAHCSDAVPPLTAGPAKLTEDAKVLSTTEGA